MSVRLDMPDPRALRALIDRAGQDYLGEVQTRLFEHGSAMTRRTPEVTWQSALNDLSGASEHQAGRLRLRGVRCPRCHGKGFDTRRAAHNMSRTGSPWVCGECCGSRVSDATVTIRYAAAP